MSRHHRWIRALYHWHRRLGVAAALLVIVLAVTGILLNHADRLHFDRQPVQNAWLLDWYGIGAPRIPPGWQADGHWFTVVDGILYMDDRPLVEARGTLRGALHQPQAELYLLAFDHALLLLDPAGEVVEWIEPLPVPGGAALGLARDGEGRALLHTAQGVWIGDAELLQWTPRDADAAPPAIPPAGLPEPLRSRLERIARARAITLERVLLDLHSGRLFGTYGPWLMDAAAVLLLLLSFSGGFLWARQVWKRRRHHRSAH